MKYSAGKNMKYSAKNVTRIAQNVELEKIWCTKLHIILISNCYKTSREALLKLKDETDLLICDWSGFSLCEGKAAPLLVNMEWMHLAIKKKTGGKGNNCVSSLVSANDIIQSLDR